MTGRTIVGLYQGHVLKGEREILLTIALPRPEGDDFVASLGERPTRAKDIPIALDRRDVAEALASFGDPPARRSRR